MKKLLCLLSLCFMTVGFVGCGGDDAAETDTPAATESDTGSETEGEEEGE